MSHLLDEILAQAANGSPATVALSAQSVTVFLFASRFLEERQNWLDRAEFPLDEVTDADWDAIEKLVGNAYYEIMTPLVGWIIPVGIGTLPDNLLMCDGSTYAREDYPALYAVLDAAFILDADNFFVPDLRSRVPVAAGTGSGLATYAVGETGGDESVTLSTDEIPSHQHGLFQSDSLAVAPGELPVVIPFLTTLGATDLTGGGGSHENRQPFIALNFAMVAF